MSGSKKHVLVIGGAGYIGSTLIRKLLANKAGYHVRLLDILLYGEAPIADLYGHPRFELIQGDFRDPTVVSYAMQDIDIVVHLGAIVGDPACAIDEDLTIQINLTATQTIAHAASEQRLPAVEGCGNPQPVGTRGNPQLVGGPGSRPVERFLFASTYSVYGASQEIVDERSALNPVSLYAHTKIDAENFLLSYPGEATFSPVVLRLSTVYGMSYRPRFDLVVNLLAARAATEKHITIIEGDQWRSFVHVQDVANAFLLCIQAPLEKVRGQIFNVGSNDHNYRLCELGDLIRQAMPDVAITYQDRVEDRRNCQVRFDKIQHELGFKPQRTLMDGILEVKQAIESSAIADWRDKQYNNCRFLSEGEGLQRLHTDAKPPRTACQAEKGKR